MKSMNSMNSMNSMKSMKRRTLIAALVLTVAGAAGAAPLAPDGSDRSAPGFHLPTSALDFGFGVQLDEPYKTPGEDARATLFFFNLTSWDAPGGWVNMGGPGCRYQVMVRDPKGRIVWRPDVMCPAAVMSFPFPAGTLLMLPMDLSMVYQASETPDPDGEPLPGGAYMMEARHDYNGPQVPGGAADEFVPGPGGEPRAEVPFRIVQCDGAGGWMPVRDLGRDSMSGYRYGEPGFHGEDLVLRTEEAALAFWAEHNSHRGVVPPPPRVDFGAEMVVVAVMGTQSTIGPSIEIVGVEEYPCHIMVQVREDMRPGQLPALSNPVHAVAVPRSLKEVLFIHAVVQGEDGGER